MRRMLSSGALALAVCLTPMLSKSTAQAAPPPPVVVTPAGPAPVPVPYPALRRGADRPAYPIAGGKGTATILFDQASGSPDTAMTVLVLKPGAAVPTHTHDQSAELLYVIEGQASMTLEGETLTLGPGDAVRIPKGKRHDAKIIGDKPFRALQVYAPAGPEQRFVPTP